MPKEETNKINTVFQDCLRHYPEIWNVKLLVSVTDTELSGSKLRSLDNQQTYISLQIPRHFIGDVSWDVLRPIIHHELSHAIDLENPDRIFKERADEKSQALWNLLQQNNAISCSHADNNTL